MSKPTEERRDAARASMIQLHRLEGFYWVARTGGYARAARAFPYPITQPAVHQQVKKLEAELGVTLFERVAKDKMKPTPAGVRHTSVESLVTLLKRHRSPPTTPYVSTPSTTLASSPYDSASVTEPRAGSPFSRSPTTAAG